MTANDDLLKKLTNWARARKILPPHEFKCPKYEECNLSHGDRYPLDHGNTCLMSYVGPEYGLPVPGGKFRLVIVGQDHGCTDLHGDYADCREGREEYYYRNRKRFNQHYRGVIKTAAAILGETGQYCLKECWNDRKCAGAKPPGGRRCVLLSFAQPNLVKCVSAPDMTSLATPIMYGNCSRHLVHELDVLTPSLVVFHGSGAQGLFCDAVENEGGKRPTPVEGSPTSWGREILFRVLRDDFKYYVLFLYHPSRGWLAKQWSEVELALKWLRAKGAIPA